MTAYLIEGAQVLLPEGLEDASLRLEDGVIAEIGAPPADGALRVDGRGLIAAPAIVDVHGDAFERSVAPRPNVYFPLEVAALDIDRQLAACGIATAYHALTLSWEPGLRAVDRGEAFVDALQAAAPRLTVDHRIQLRWETFAETAMPLMRRVLADGPTPAVAFNDHTSMTMRSFDTAITERAFEQSPDFQACDPADPRLRARAAKYADRAGLDLDEYLRRMLALWERRGDVDGWIKTIAAEGRAAGAPMLSHDDTQDETRDYYRGLGATIAEFPMREPVARAAKAAGDAIVFGSPNAMRGGSHIGAVSAGDMVEADLCDALASDYAYPAMLAAAGRLLADKRAALPAVWSRFSAGPARALGLDDRGRLAPGLRADVVLLEWPDGGTPAARATFSAGRLAHLSGDLLR